MIQFPHGSWYLDYSSKSSKQWLVTSLKPRIRESKLTSKSPSQVPIVANGRDHSLGDLGKQKKTMGNAQRSKHLL